MIGEPPHLQLRIGFVARKDIAYGEELFFHYGLKSHPDFPWITTDAKKIGITLQKIDPPKARYLYCYIYNTYFILICI